VRTSVSRSVNKSESVAATSRRLGNFGAQKRGVLGSYTRSSFRIRMALVRPGRLASFDPDEPFVDRLRNRLGSVDHVQTLHCVIAVKVDRPLAQAEDDRNLG